MRFVGSNQPMQIRRALQIVLHSLFTTCVLAVCAVAHPGSGIAVDRRGQVYFVDTGQGVWKVDAEGRVTPHEGPAFHWMAIDVDDRFARVRFPSFPSAEVKHVGGNPTLILSSDFPLVVGSDGALYYAQLGRDGRLQVIRLTAKGDRSVLATLPASTESGPLRWLNGMAAGGNGSIYYTENAAVRKITSQGTVSTIAAKVTVANCVRIPGMEKELGPYLRGLAVAPDGTAFVAATGCGTLLKIAVGGTITPVLQTTSPWSPTDVAVAGDDLYVLEYLHTASDNRREWVPRVTKVSPDGKVAVIAAIERK